MHFAYPPRKDSNPPPWSSRSRTRASPIRARVQPLALTAVAAIGFIWLLVHLLHDGSGSGSARTYVPPGTPKAVVVTVFDHGVDKKWRATIMQNRIDYAARHGYTTFFPNSSDYSTGNANTPRSWAMLPALRHAMTLYPHTPWLFHLAPSAIIMRPQYSLEEHLVEPRTLESLMLTDVPVVPPDSVIHTFSHLKGENIDLVLSQDGTGLAAPSMLIRTGEWARFLLDAWYDPLYRSYNFQKAERHALEHLVQWHGTILARLALVPQRYINSYVEGSASKEADPAEAAQHAKDRVYEEGDFIANFEGCLTRPWEKDDAVNKGVKVRRQRNECAKEQAALLARWREMIDHEGRN